MEGGSSFFEVYAAGGKVLHSIERRKPTDLIRRNPPGTTNMLYWGEDNMYPQYLNSKIEQSPILSSKLPLFAGMLASGGVEYGTETKNGFEVAFDKEVQDYNDQINLAQFLADFPIEMMKFNAGFAEMIVSKDRSMITNVVAQETTFSRVSRKDAPDLKGKPQRWYGNAQWDMGDDENSELTETRTLIDPYFNRLEQVREGKDYSYILPVWGPSSGRIGYPEPMWTSAIKSKWLDYSLAIPIAKMAMIDNAMMVIIHIEVPNGYWKSHYPDWDKKPELQASRKEESQKRWTETICSKENWGKTIMTSYEQLLDGKTGQHILFKVLPNPFKDSILIDDSFEAGSQIFQALGQDATLTGTIPGKQMGAGSGSDKEWAWILAMVSNKVMMDLMLAPIQYAYDYNGFKYKLRMANYELARQYMLKSRGDKKDPNPSNVAK